MENHNITTELNRLLEDKLKRYIEKKLTVSVKDLEQNCDAKVEALEKSFHARISELENKVKTSSARLEAIEKELAYAKKDLSIFEKEAKLHVEYQKMQHKKLTEDVAQSVVNLGSTLNEIKKECDDLKNKSFNLQGAQDSLKMEIAKLAASNVEVSKVKTDIDSLKSANKKLDDACCQKHTSLNAELTKFTTDFRYEKEKLVKELQGHQFNMLSSHPLPAVRDINKYFAAGMCYFKWHTGRNDPPYYKCLFCPKMLNNYIKRVRGWSALKVERPFEVTIRNEVFRITEYHKLRTAGLDEIFYIVPQIFEDYDIVYGLGFFYRRGNGVSILQNDVILDGCRYKLYDCFK